MNEQPNKLAATLKERKAREHWTFKEMAEVVGTVPPTVLSWTRETRPEPEFWPGIAKLLGWRVEEVAQALGLASESPRVQAARLQPDEQSLLDAYREAKVKNVEPALRSFSVAIDTVEWSRELQTRADREREAAGTHREDRG